MLVTKIVSPLPLSRPEPISMFAVSLKVISDTGAVNESVMFADNGFQDPPQCMPDEYKCDDYVQAYRNYYMAEKKYFAAWGKGVPAPAWWLTQTNESPSIVL